MKNRIAIAAEGPSDRAVLKTLCVRANHHAKVGFADGKDSLFIKFDKILRALEASFHPTHFLVVPDLHPQVDCPAEADRWRREVRKRFPRADVCLCIWELESWLLADPKAVSSTLNVTSTSLPEPDRIGGEPPSSSLEKVYRKVGGYKRGVAYHKEADGRVLAERLDLEVAAKKSSSLNHFLRAIKSRQTTIIPE